MTAFDVNLSCVVVGSCMTLGAWYRGASVKTLVGAAVAGALLGYMTLSVIYLGGLVAVIAAAVFLAVWLTLFLLVRRVGH